VVYVLKFYIQILKYSKPKSDLRDRYVKSILKQANGYIDDEKRAVLWSIDMKTRGDEAKVKRLLNL